MIPRRFGLDVAGALRRLPVGARIGLGFVVLIGLVGVFAPLLMTQDPAAPALAAPTNGPDGQFWFGVDRLGRDVFSRLVAGTRRSLVVGFGSAGLALIAGALLGGIAGSSRRAVDEIIMRLLDVIMAFPTIVLAALLVVAYGKNNLLVIVAAIAFVFTPQIARVVRANVASQYQEDYVSAERVIGARKPHIIVRHIMPNVAAPVLVFATIMVANAVVFEASLSFIGAGLAPEDGDSSWGSVIAYGQQLLASHGWWATFFPGLFILATVLALNVLAEGISRAWDVSAMPARALEVAQRDRLGSPEPGSGTVAPLPGLADAARRFAARVRPVPTGTPVLSVSDLRIDFPGRHGGRSVVDGVSFDVLAGEVLGLAGESGCGKSLTALTVLGLQAASARVSGQVRFAGQDVLALRGHERRALLGTGMAMVYQDALSALNPAMTVRAQLNQLVCRGGTRSPQELMDLVGLDVRRTLSAYPHELSGGQRQRVLIAMALSRDPKLLIADEPTTALDVTVQAQVIGLLQRLRADLGFAMVFVSHDIALLSDVCDRVAVMYGGQIAEAGTVADVLSAPAHHYTRGLLGAVLSMETRRHRLLQIRGVVPAPADFPRGCRFADRCPLATEVCQTTVPSPTGDAMTHLVACHHPAERLDPQKLVMP